MISTEKYVDYAPLSAVASPLSLFLLCHYARLAFFFFIMILVKKSLNIFNFSYEYSLFDPKLDQIEDWSKLDRTE